MATFSLSTPVQSERSFMVGVHLFREFMGALVHEGSRSWIMDEVDGG